MKNSEERIRLLHKRAKEMQRHSDRNALLVSGGVSSVLFVFLIGFILRFHGQISGYTNNIFSASSLFSDRAGGYVLVAVIFFMAGVAITIFLTKRLKKENKGKSKTQTHGTKEEL